MILVISAAQSLQARVPVTLDLEDLPGLGPQPVLQPGPVGADSAGVEELLEDSVWPGLVQLHSGCEMIEVSEGGEVLREGTQSGELGLIFPTFSIEQSQGMLLSAISKSPIGTFWVPGMLTF